MTKEAVSTEDLRRASLLLVEAVSHLGMAVSDLQGVLSEIQATVRGPDPNRPISARVADVGEVHVYLAAAWERLGDANTALGATDD